MESDCQRARVATAVEISLILNIDWYVFFCHALVLLFFVGRATTIHQLESRFPTQRDGVGDRDTRQLLNITTSLRDKIVKSQQVLFGRDASRHAHRNACWHAVHKAPSIAQERH